jgi:hypothetical protein
MCPPLSCCHHRGTSVLRRQLYCLVRLLLASSSAEVPAARQAALAARLDVLWDCLHSAMQQYYRVSPGRAQELTGQVVHTLLREECCCQSVRDAISLEEALGLAEAPSAIAARPLARPAAPEPRPYWARPLPGGSPRGSALLLP